MAKYLQNFITASESKAGNREHREKLRFNIDQYDHSVIKGKRKYKDLELAKKRTARIKTKAIENLENHLKDFEVNFTNNGGKIIWAENAQQAISAILEVLKRAGAKMVVKGKSMTTEEIHLNKHLEANGIEPVETDLGEFIVQLAGEAPYHIVTPAMHKSKEDVARLFNEKKGLPADSTPEDITRFVRGFLREKFIEADVGITGGNFIIADIGGVAITENEGNALLSVAFPKIHIAVVGIEKLIPYMKDLDLFWSLLATYGTGQHITVYNTILTGPRRENETDGPDEMYVVMLDNGRTNVLADPELRQSLNCIRCGACLNGCPIYKNIGGHAYGATYSGPIGSIITPHFKGINDFVHLSFASSLCGKCTEVCPVKIDLHKLLLHNRNHSVKMDRGRGTEKLSMFLWKMGMLNRKKMNRISAGIKNILLKFIYKKSWGNRRELPKIAKKSFNEIWREEHKI